MPPRSNRFTVSPPEWDLPATTLKNLQRLLHQYGYLVVKSLGKSTRTDTEASALPAVDKLGEGVVETKLALRHYQTFRGLFESGELDTETARRLNRPRCGVPDYQRNGRPTASTFGQSWPSNHLRYRIESRPANADTADIDAAFDVAFTIWANVTPLKFQKVGAGQAADLVINFGSSATGNDPEGWLTGKFGTLAYAYFPVDGRLFFDANETWVVETPTAPEEIDLISVAAHEIGHALGLHHSDETLQLSGGHVVDDLMYSEYRGPHRFLAPQDIDRIRAVYPPA